MNWNKQYIATHPLAHKAHMILANAIEYRKIQRQPCERCGNPKSHGHHEDYTKPLEVIWLCSKCHGQRHAEINALAEGKELSRPYRPQSQKHIKREPIWPHRIRYQPAPKRDQFLQRATQLRASGMSYKQIAKELQTNQGQVYKWLNPREYN